MTLSPRLLALATAVPRHRLRQEEVAGMAISLFDREASDIERMLPVFAHAGIASRYSCVPLDWYLRPHGWRERTALYIEHAVDLLTEAAEACLARAKTSRDEIGGIVVVSTTGIATPSLDALVMERLSLPRDLMRLPIFGLGCVGGVMGLSHAAGMARALAGRPVLLLVVELCALTFRFGDNSKSNIVAAALFGDGAAAALIGHGEGPILGPGGAHTWAGSLDIMGWRAEDDGLGVMFSRDIPALVREQLRPAADDFLARHGLSPSQLAGIVCHPGGIKVLDALEAAFDLPAGAMTAAREVLRDYGNMSAATVLFVLERLMAGGLAGRYLVSALGPGFTAGFQMLEAR